MVILGFWGVIGRRFEGPKIDWEALKVSVRLLFLE